MGFRWSEIWKVFEGFPWQCIENCSRKQTWQFYLLRTEPLTWKECTMVLSGNNNRYAIQFLTKCNICTCLSLVKLWWKNPSIVMFVMHDKCLRKCQRQAILVMSVNDFLYLVLNWYVQMRQVYIELVSKLPVLISNLHLV